jgi:hypothetical protein
MFIAPLIQRLVALPPAGKLVKFAPLTAGNVAGKRASGTVPDVRLLALKAVRSFAVFAAIAELIELANLSAVTASSAMCAVSIDPST